MQAGLIAVPLPAPQPGGYDERVSGALRDCSPAVILTTSAVVADVMPYADMRSGTSAPRVIEIDALDLESPRAFDAPVGPYPEAAYLQYTSGSTRQPSGVVVTHRNVIANWTKYFPTTSSTAPNCRRRTSNLCRGCPSFTTWGWYRACLLRCWSQPRCQVKPWDARRF